MYSVLRYLLIGIILCTAVVLRPSSAQSNGKLFSPKANQLFDSGIKSYEKKAYLEAKSKFEQILKLPDNHRSSAASLMLGKCYFHLGEFDSAWSSAINVEDSYPSSRYITASYLLRADIFYKKKRFFEAAEFLTRTILFD